MTNEEIMKFEGWLTYDVREGDEHRISFKPDIMLRDSRFSTESIMRNHLAAYLRRVAQYLEA